MIANDEKYLQEYLRNFFKAYHLKSKDLKELDEWCKNYLGRRYLDWNLWKKNHNLLYIREHRKCTLFELRWSELIIKVVDKKYFDSKINN